jgi:hypothetical protein
MRGTRLSDVATETARLAARVATFGRSSSIPNAGYVTLPSASKRS